MPDPMSYDYLAIPGVMTGIEGSALSDPVVVPEKCQVIAAAFHTDADILTAATLGVFYTLWINEVPSGVKFRMTEGLLADSGERVNPFASAFVYLNAGDLVRLVSDSEQIAATNVHACLVVVST